MRNLCMTALSVSDATSQVSAKIDAGQLVSGSVLASFSDTDAGGTVTVEASNDPCGFGNVAADFTPSNWVLIPNASATVTSGGSVMIVMANMAFRWVRVRWTQTTPGTGTITANLNALGV